MDLAEEIVRSVRQIVRTVGLHSRSLLSEWGITTSQLGALRETARSGPLSSGALAREVGVSQATVTRLVDRLETRGLVERVRDPDDRRRVMISVTPGGRALLKRVPPPLHATLTRRLESLPDEEQRDLLESVRKLSALVGAEDVDAAPILAPEPELDAEGTP